MKKKIKLLSILSIAIVYIIASLIIDNEFILPSLYSIFTSLLRILSSEGFFNTIFLTISRTLIGVMISFIIALICSLLSYYDIRIRYFLEPIDVFFKTIPNITYIIISLIWLGRNSSVVLVSSLVILPIFYNSLLNAFLSIDKSLINVTRILSNDRLFNIKRIYIPLIFKDVMVAFINCFSLAFKVSIMAEILSQVKSGIGKELYFAKSNYLMSDILAWTIIIIMLSSVFEHFIKKILLKVQK